MKSRWIGRAWRAGVAALCLASGLAFAQDLVLQHQDSPDPGPAGGLFTYTMRIDNNGPGNATGVTLSDTLPTNATFQSFTTTAGTCTTPPVGSGGTVACTLGGIAQGTFQTVTVAVRLPTAGTYTNNASVGSTSVDPNPANNSFAQTTTAVSAADLALTATSSSANVPAGGSFTYGLTVVNNGPNVLANGSVLRISFTVPTGSAITGFSGGYSCTPSATVNAPLTSGNVTCTITLASGLAVGATAPGLTVNAIANAQGTIAASFATSATTADGVTTMPDGELANNAASANVTVTAGTDVQITQSASPTTVAQGSNVVFTLTPRLNGGDPVATGPGDVITVTDTLGAGLTFVSAAGTGWTCNAVGQVVTCTRPGPFSSNFTNLPTIAITATATGVGSLGNTAVISVPENDSNPANNTSSLNITSSNEADLRMNKSASLNPVVVGQAFEYRLSVTNLGPLAVTSTQTITVTDTLPATVELTAAPTGAGFSCTPTAGFPIAAAAISCTRTGALGVNGTTSTITVPVRQTAAGSVSNLATVALSGAGPVDNTAPNNTASANTTATTAIGSVDLEVVSKTATPATVVAGQDLTYVVTVRNNGPATATNVVVTDSLNSLVNIGGFQSAVPSQGSCSPSTATNGTSRTLTCSLGSLNSGATATVTIVVRPNIATTGTRTNTAAVRTNDQGDSNQGNNSNSVTSNVTAIVDLTASKTATPSTGTPGTVPAGAPLLYTVTLTNNGPSSAQNVSMTDTLPTNAAFIALVSVSNSGTCTTVPAANAVGGTLVCSWAADVPNGEQRTVTYRVRPLNSAVGGSVVNSVVASTSTPETSTANNSATTTTAVTPAVLDILVNKVDSADPVSLGDLTTYTVTITNNGPSFGTNVVLTDVFPAPATTPTAVFSYQGSLTVNTGGTCTEPAVGATSGTILCTFPVLANLQTATVTYVMRAESIPTPGATSGTLSSRASVTVNETETQLANNVAIENTTTNRAAVVTDLSIVKTAGSSSVSAGATLVYTLTVTNLGGAASSGAQVLDTLPTGLTFVSAPGCAVAGNVVSCVVGNLAPAGVRVFTVTTTVTGPAGGALTNTAIVDAPGDPVPGNNTSTVTTTVPGSSNAIPTLSEWALIAMSMLLALMGMRRIQGRKD